MIHLRAWLARMHKHSPPRCRRPAPNRIVSSENRTSTLRREGKHNNIPKGVVKKGKVYEGTKSQKNHLPGTTTLAFPNNGTISAAVNPAAFGRRDAVRPRSEGQNPDVLVPRAAGGAAANHARDRDHSDSRFQDGASESGRRQRSRRGRFWIQ